MARLGYLRATLLASVALTATACTSVLPGTAAAERTPTSAPGSTTAGTVDPTLERPANLSTIQEIAFDGMAEGLSEAAAELAAGEDPTFSCVVVLAYAEGPETADLAAATKAREQCGREIPIAWATSQLDAAEASGDLASSIGECASAMVALDTVRERFTDPRLDELDARAENACP